MKKSKYYKLSEVASIDLSSIDKKNKDQETSVLLCNFTDVYNNWAITKDLSKNFMRATASDKEIKQFSLKKGQIAITKDSETRDDIGISTYIADTMNNVVLGYHCALITPDQSIIDAKYLNSYFQSPIGRKYFSLQAGGSGQRYTLTKDSIGSIEIPVIDLFLQKKIGRFLSLIDRLIANNKHIIHTIESIAKIIYNYWFVQFDFPDEKGCPYKKSGGKMVYNAVLDRDIPEKWDVVRLRDLTSYSSDTAKMITSKNYIGIDNMLPNMQGITESSYDVPVGNITGFEKNDILIGNIRPYFKKIWLSDSYGGCSPDVLVLRPNEYELCGYLYYSLANDFFFDYDTAGEKKGTKMPRGDKNHIMDFPLAFDKKLALFYGKIVRNICLKKNLLMRENNALSCLRDFLLPMLINGQVTFNNEM